ncbi:FEM1B [Branchiostoma lanceolatum]|uniref:FEM1B protein n=2 Tax=Branchiostoma lanceolatum TaxID=7740 RepID=A0A8S4MN16_BRALA|nr:FEM1B [Branchiostoma lanceolatum]
MSLDVEGGKMELPYSAVFNAAGEGKVLTLAALLHNKTSAEARELLTHVTEDSQGQAAPPLVIAAKNGHCKVVRFILETYEISVDQTGVVKFDGYIIEGASSLWCAAGRGHFEVVKDLISHRANVNHRTLTNSTPLRAACFDGRLDIVRYLIENKADIHIANKYENTCLMIACYKGHIDVVSYLLEVGANPNSKAHCGATALHFAGECGHLEIVKELIMKGATPQVNDHGMTPLMLAADSSHAEVVEYLVSLPGCDRVTKVETLELLGASFANNKDNYSLDKAYHYMYEGMVERFADEPQILHKKILPPTPAYDSRIESMTVNALQAIQDNPHAIHMEALMVRERILGSSNPEVPHPIIYRGAVYADGMYFDRCINLWMHALKLRQTNNRNVQKDLLRFAQVFAQMIRLGEDVDADVLAEVMECCLAETKLAQQRYVFSCMLMHMSDSELQTTFQHNMLTMMYLFGLIAAVKTGKEQDKRLKKLVYEFLRMRPQTKSGCTPLHLAVSQCTPVDDFHINDICKFPSPNITQLLIECGADVNATNNDGNTPLHLIVQYDKPISDFLTLHFIVTKLIQGGAHIDKVNNAGKTAVQTSTTGVSEVVLKTQTKVNLKCLSARAVKTHGLKYKGQVPREVEAFVDIH